MRIKIESGAADLTLAKARKKELTTREIITGLITYLCRIFTGIVFCYSGYVKAIDPWGTIYKLQDYLAALDAQLFLPLVTVGAFLLFSLEFLVGVALVTGSYRRFAPICATAFMAVMLPLTLWIALADPVEDCGCFGDALLLSNWATFWKNVVLTATSIWLVIFNKRIRCFILPTLQVWELTFSLAFIVIIGWWGYTLQPLVDYRPYPEGGPLISSDDSEVDFKSVWSKDGEEIVLPPDSIPGEGWEFVRREQTGETERQKARGLAIFEQGDDVTEDVLLDEGKQVVIFFNSLPEVSMANFYKLNSLYAYTTNNDIDMIAVAAADSIQIAAFRDASLAEYPIYSSEDTAIKEVVRGNPAMVYMVDGKIIWKNAFQAVPTEDFMNGETTDLALYQPIQQDMLYTLWFLYIVATLLLLILSHMPMLFRKIFRRRKVVAAIIALALLPGFMQSCSDKKDEPSLPNAKSDKLTVLVYMVASNNLFHNSEIDIEEMLTGIEACNDKDINLLVYYVSRENTPTLSIAVKGTAGLAEFKELKTYTPDLSLTEQRVQEVIADARAYAPAEKMGIFLWSHASNWIPTTKLQQAPARSFGDDKGKSMNITTLSNAIPSGLSFIWMDCCLMGSIEVAYQFREKCDTYVAYPTEVLSCGAPYDVVLPALAGEEGSVEKAARLTYEYFAKNSMWDMRNFTVSVVDTDYLDAIADACHGQLDESSTPDLNYLQRYGSFGGVSFYDFKQTCDRLNPELTAELSALMNRAVIYKAATPDFLSITINPENYSGLSITIPSLISNSDQKSFYHELDWYKKVYTR